MGIVECPRCEKSYLKPRAEEGTEKLCGSCKTEIQSKLNRFDREYTMKDDQDLEEAEYNEKMQKMHEEKVRKVKYLISDVPPEHLPSDIAQMAEEIIDPKIRNRSFCIGTLEEIEMGNEGVELRDFYDPKA